MIHEMTVRVRYVDTDQMRVVYYARYLEWFEMGRTELLRELGFPYHHLEQQGLYLPVTEAHCNYAQPAYYDDLVTIKCLSENLVEALRQAIREWVFG